MSVLDTIKSVVGFESGMTTHHYRCVDCDNEFESGKDPDRVTCMECLGNDVELIEDN